MAEHKARHTAASATSSRRHAAHAAGARTDAAQAEGARSGSDAPSRQRRQGLVSEGTSTMRMSERTARATSHARSQAGGRHGGARPQPRRSGIVAILVICLALVAVGAFAFVRFRRVAEPSGPTVAAGQEVRVTIPDGAGGSQISQILRDAGVISDDAAFQKAVQSQNAESSMHSGTYTFLTGANVDEVVRRLVAGPDSSGNLTITEGQTLSSVAQTVESSLGISQQDFLDQAKASNYVADYPFLASAQDDSLEGFLFPWTYDISDGATADTVIRAMLDQYQKQVASLDFATAEQNIQSAYGIQTSDYDILTIASIIEKEALTDDDRYNISSVIYNRLKAGMALQSDATMGYVTGGQVTADDLKTDSPYNTYLHTGLTPTPICNPGIKSIQAAMNPASTNYLYFWITQDEHVFSETYDQHLQAISQAQGQSAQAQ